MHSYYWHSATQEMSLILFHSDGMGFWKTKFFISSFKSNQQNLFKAWLISQNSLVFIMHKLSFLCKHLCYNIQKIVRMILILIYKLSHIAHMNCCFVNNVSYWNVLIKYVTDILAQLYKRVPTMHTSFLDFISTILSYHYWYQVCYILFN